MAIPAYLFDAAGKDRPVELDDGIDKRLKDHELLWVDLADPSTEELERVVSLLSLHRQSLRNLVQPIHRPRVDNFGEYFSVNVAALAPNDELDVLEVDLFAGPNYVVTVHQEDVPYLNSFVEQLPEDTKLGQLDAPAFLAALLDWHVSSYFEVIEILERQIDRLDVEALSRMPGDEVLDHLVDLRRRVARVRRVLAPHREVFAALARPDFEPLARSGSAAQFRTLNDRLERCIDTIEHVREMVIGSFELFMTRTAQRTNEVMKALTLVSVVLLPAVVIAGIMGMNFKVGFFDDTSLFWLVLGGMVVLALSTVGIARLRRWI
jgi:magnesium transporter